MYKKITHTIVEEHFDHPIGGQIKKTIERSGIPTSEILSESKFKADVHNYFETYINHLTSLINSTTGPQENFLMEFDNFFKTPWIDNLGTMISVIYQTEFGEKINESLRMIATTIFSGLQFIKEGKDYGPITNRVNFITYDLSQTLNNFNNAWSYQITNPLFNSLFMDLFALAKAKITKNTIQEQQLLQKITNSWSTFENLLIDGIIKQHPERFAKSMTSMNTSSLSNKDIM
jgi:hypothetical protein